VAEAEGADGSARVRLLFAIVVFLASVAVGGYGAAATGGTPVSWLVGTLPVLFGMGLLLATVNEL
jgi:hypothetical protein